MKDWLKAILLLIIVACVVLAHMGLIYIIDEIGWSKIAFYPFSALIFFLAALAVKGVTDS